ncbi:MAG: ABC transporter ATP-binding protein [Eubacteriales bacterium]|nr:ABC transporter ATP-binding protein [Eubacteriales bacterium]
MEDILNINDLVVRYHTETDTVNALNNISLTLKEGETLGLVGETGAGKTTLAKSIMQLIAFPGKIESGSIEYDGRNLLELPIEEIQKIRGNDISMIFQDPMSSLNPVITVGDQIAEVIETHDKCTHQEALEKAKKMLEMVGIAPERYKDYPHQFSGGMKQRVVISIALACNPKILIADEPTTALDVTIQAQVLEMMRDLRQKYNTATILITHDLGIVAQMCDRVAIIYAGEIIETGNLQDIYKHTAHPYTEGLLGSIPQINKDVKRLTPIEGLMPDPTKTYEGCAFAERCKYATDACRSGELEFRCVSEGHYTKCILDAPFKGGEINE